MTKKNTAFKMNADLSDIFVSKTVLPRKSEGMPIAKALNIISRNMETAGFRARTISDYNMHVTHFAKITEAEKLEEINAASITIGSQAWRLATKRS